ncbi:amino acid adenylation domain-containing protein [Amycolatopsis sp. cmx-4-68]|uniref:amino acid adenylation domain-containing protein n=1 Tax=Amycolatopsis sp. cmx-4-68 TaxID=2790938 RepID=UPI00397C43E1
MVHISPVEHGTIDAAFAAIARRFPDRIAVRAGGERLTYADLDAASDRVAGTLRARGARPGDVVGVQLARSAEAVVTLLAILKVGAAYLGLDHRQPAAVREGMLADAAARLVLVDEVTGAGEPARPERDPAPAAAVVPDPGRVAYVAFTSGSTGRPKGVCVPHRAVLRLVADPAIAETGPDDVWLQFAPVAFDASTLEIWGALLTGATLSVAPAEVTAIADLLDHAAAERVTVLWLTAGLFHEAAGAGLDRLVDLRYLLAGGDVLDPADVNTALRQLPGCAVVNGYGPTENTTFTCCHPVREPVTGPVPIGRPVRATGVHLLDERLRPVPDGEVGELYTDGLGLARGYVGRPAETAARFVAHPFAGRPGERLYRTGDLARRRPDGALEFLGRRDGQVKIRGFRVEVAAVTAVLTGHPAVSQAVVLVKDGAAGRSLTGYAVAGASPSELRDWLAARLPEYAVPTGLHVFDALPLTAHGKVDRAALAALGQPARPELNAEYRAPATPGEHAVVALWSDRLGISGIGADDDFFELGGHSLLAVSLVEHLRARYGVRISPLDFYLDPTPAGLARLVDAHDQATTGTVR